MASFVDRLARFARTPQGRRVVSRVTAKAQQLSKDPATRAKVERLRGEVTRRMNGPKRPKG